MSFDVRRISIRRHMAGATPEHMAGMAEEFFGKLIPARDPQWLHFEFYPAEGFAAQHHLNAFRTAVHVPETQPVPSDGEL